MNEDNEMLLERIASLIPTHVALDMVRAWGERQVDEYDAARFGAALVYCLATRGDADAAVELLAARVKRSHVQFPFSTLVVLIAENGNEYTRERIVLTLEFIVYRHRDVLERALDVLQDIDLRIYPKINDVLYKAVDLDARLATHPTVIKAALSAAIGRY